MKRKNIVGIIAIAAIVAVVMFAGCVEKNLPQSAQTPTLNPSPTLTPKLPNINRLLSYPMVPKQYHVTYSVVIYNDDAEIKELEVWMPKPSSYDSQKIERVDILTMPYNVMIDKYGNTIIHWENLDLYLENFKSLELPCASMAIYCTLYETKNYINRGSVGQYNKTDSQYLLYTCPEQFIESNDTQIITTANNIAGNITNPYDKACLIYDWTLAHMEYEKKKGLNSAKRELESGYGDCWEYSVLFSALCRAEGIPTRLVLGFWLEEEESFSNAMSRSDANERRILNPTGHVWTEVYIPNYGWIPIDASMGDSDKYYKDYYFGNLDNERLIFQKGGVHTLEIAYKEHGDMEDINVSTEITIEYYKN